MSAVLSMKLLQMLQTEGEGAGGATTESSSASTQCVSSSSTATRSSNEEAAAVHTNHCEHDDSRVSLLSDPSTAADSPAGIASPHWCG